MLRTFTPFAFAITFNSTSIWLCFKKSSGQIVCFICVACKSLQVSAVLMIKSPLGGGGCYALSAYTDAAGVCSVLREARALQVISVALIKASPSVVIASLPHTIMHVIPALHHNTICSLPCTILHYGPYLAPSCVRFLPRTIIT